MRIKSTKDFTWAVSFFSQIMMSWVLIKLQVQVLTFFWDQRIFKRASNRKLTIFFFDFGEHQNNDGERKPSLTLLVIFIRKIAVIYKEKEAYSFICLRRDVCQHISSVICSNSFSFLFSFLAVILVSEASYKSSKLICGMTDLLLFSQEESSN